MEKILLIGENRPFLESIADEFEKLGFKAFTAGEEDEGSKFITSEVPDVMILTYGIKRFNPLKLVFKLREVNLLAKLVYLHPETIKPSPPDESFYIFVPDSLPPDLIVTKIIEAIDNASPIGEMAIKDVLWLLNFEKRSAFIRIFTDEAEGEIIVKDGDPVSCKLGIDTGDEALSNLVGLETIAYEISWDIPQEVERNVTQSIETFVGRTFSEEGMEEEEAGVKDFEDLSKELERDIENLAPEEPGEFTLNEFPSFEEEKESSSEAWDLEDLEDIGKELAGGEEESKIEEPVEEDLSSLLSDEDIFKTEEKKETPMEGLNIEETELPSDFEFPEEITFEEEKTEEKLPEEKEEIPGLEELGAMAEEEKEEPEQFAPPFEKTGEEQQLEQIPLEEQPFTQPEVTQKEEEVLVPEISEEKKSFHLNIDEVLQSKLLTKSSEITGLASFIVLKGEEVISTSSEKDIEELEKYYKAGVDEAFFKARQDIFVLVTYGEISLIGKWKHTTPGYALFTAKRLLREIQS